MAIIDVTNLHKRYGDKIAVDDVSFSVEEGEIFGILGANGAGKTTTVECIDGLRRRDGGTISVLGLDPGTHHEQLTRLVGVQLQESELNDKIRVGEAMALFSTFYDDPADSHELLAELGLADSESTPYKKLSGGQKQRLSIALALLGQPRIAVLDELTTGLDPKGRRDTWALIERIRDRGVTILLVTHFMEEAARLCDRVAIIDRGRVVAIDTPAAIASRVQAEQVLHFRLSRDVPADITVESMRRLPEVSDVRVHVGPAGSQYTVTGTSAAFQAVLVSLDRQGAVAAELRIDSSSLDDAFVALTAADAPVTPTEPVTETV